MLKKKNQGPVQVYPERVAGVRSSFIMEAEPDRWAGLQTPALLSGLAGWVRAEPSAFLSSPIDSAGLGDLPRLWGAGVNPEQVWLVQRLQGSCRGRGL